MKRKSIKIIATTLLLSTILSFTSLADWEQSEAGWKYKDDGKGVYLVNGWYWLDGNNDNVAECYYLDSAGIMAVNTMVDSYTINADGQWTVDNVVQTRVVGSGSQTSGTSFQDLLNDVGDKPVPIDPEFLQKWKEATFY